MKTTMTIGPMAEQIIKIILQDFGNAKTGDYLKVINELPEVVNQ